MFPWFLFLDCLYFLVSGLCKKEMNMTQLLPKRTMIMQLLEWELVLALLVSISALCCVAGKIFHLEHQLWKLQVILLEVI